MFCPRTAPNRADKIAAHGACFPIVCAQRRPVPTRTTDTVPNRDQPPPPPSAPFPHRHLPAPRGFLLGRFPNAGRCHARRSRPPRPASENLHQCGRSSQRPWTSESSPSAGVVELQTSLNCASSFSFCDIGAVRLLGVLVWHFPRFSYTLPVRQNAFFAEPCFPKMGIV